MLVHISKDLLTTALRHVYKAILNNSPIPLLSGIYIHAGSDGVVFSGSNTSLTIQYKADIQDASVRVLKTGGIVCHAKYVYELVRKLNEGSVVLEVNEQLTLQISSENTQVRLSGMTTIDYPSISPLNQHEAVQSIRVPSNLLISIIKQVAGTVSTSETKPILTGVLLVVQGNLLTMIATDGVVRMATRSIAIENIVGFSGQVVVPGTNLLEISKLLVEDDSEIVTIQLQNHQIRFITRCLLVKSVLIEGFYPSTRDLVPSHYASEIIVNMRLLRQTVYRVSVLADYSLITMQVSELKLDLISNTPEIGEITDAVPLEAIRGENFRITINGKYLISTLRLIETDSIRIRFGGKKNPIILLPVLEDSSWLFLLTPVMTR